MPGAAVQVAVAVAPRCAATTLVDPASTDPNWRARYRIHVPARPTALFTYTSSLQITMYSVRIIPYPDTWVYVQVTLIITTKLLLNVLVRTH